jgi:malonyl-CoA/methylmalonyl-CoA synthetase
MNHNFYSSCQTKFDLNKPFLIDEHGQTFLYRDLDVQSAIRARWLKELGLETGDRVIMQVEKSAQNLFWYFACLRAGLTYLPLNNAYQPQELAYFVENAKPSLVICDPEQKNIFADFNHCPVETLDAKGQFSQPIPTMDSGQSLEDVVLDEDTIAVILYTSGTTGKPKGAMITHGNLLANAETLSEAWQWRADDIMLHALPVFHIHGLFVATHLPVLNNSTIRFLSRFAPDTVIQNLPQSTVYMGVPTNYTRLLQAEAFNRDTCRNMRLFTSGSAPLLKQTFEQMVEQTGHRIVERYGMTETGMNTSNPLDGDRKPGTVGPALPGVEARIVDEQGRVVAIKEPGNLEIRGPNVFKGYWQMPEKTAEEFTADGFFKTGDVASIDADGYISIVGRDKDMVISGGLNVYPKEIESIIDRIEGVLESAIIGTPDSDFGEAVTAIIVRSDQSIDEIKIRAHLKTLLANFKQPKRVHFIDELPRNTMGKVQKNLLREQFNTET